MKRLRPSISDEQRMKVLLVHERLRKQFGGPIPRLHDLDPVSRLVASILEQRTKKADSDRAFTRLREWFADWADVRDAPTDDVEAAIAPCAHPELKAPRIQHVLMLIEERHGSLSLDFLADLPVPEARAWLERLPGVGPRMSAAVLLLSTLRRPALPVDSHHHRVARRLGLIPAHLEIGPAHAVLEAQLPPNWSAQQVYENHEALMIHGRNTCHPDSPACDRCPIIDLCPHGQGRKSGAFEITTLGVPVPKLRGNDPGS